MYYEGKVKASSLFTTIVSKITAIQPGETAAWWKKESSLEADGVYTSTGSTGSERIVAILRPGIVGHYITVGFARDYTPGAINTAGAFDVMEVTDMRYFSAVQASGDVEVTYHLNVTKDRIILHLAGDKLISTWSNCVTYIGMPIRYDVTDKRCIVKAMSENSLSTSACRLIQDSLNQTLQDYPWSYTAAPDGPSWGNNYFLEPLHFGKSGEGLRGELDGLFRLHSAGVVDGNIINSNGSDYLVIKRQSNGNNSFPRTTLALKMS